MSLRSALYADAKSLGATLYADAKVVASKAGAGLKAGAVKLGGLTRTAIVKGYDALANHFGPAVGAEFGKLHLGEVLRSFYTSAGFTGAAGFLVLVMTTFDPWFLSAISAVASPSAAAFASLFLTFVVDLLRRINQQAPAVVGAYLQPRDPDAPAPAPAPTPAPGPARDPLGAPFDPAAPALS